MAHLIMQEVHSVKMYINTTPTANDETWSLVGAGFDNMQEQLNEVVQQYKFLPDEGFGRSRVTGMQPVWTLSGRRIWGDAAQDFIFSQKYKTGANRETEAKVEYAAGNYNYTITFDCTLANLQEIGGATEENSAVTVEIHCAGKPTLTKEAIPA